MPIVAGVDSFVGVAKKGNHCIWGLRDAIVTIPVVLGHGHVVGELHVLEGVAAQLLDLLEELSSFAIPWVEVEREQGEPLAGDEVVVAIAFGDQPEMKAGDLARHLAQFVPFLAGSGQPTIECGCRTFRHRALLRDIPPSGGGAGTDSESRIDPANKALTFLG